MALERTFLIPEESDTVCSEKALWGNNSSWRQVGIFVQSHKWWSTLSRKQAREIYMYVCEAGWVKTQAKEQGSATVCRIWVTPPEHVITDGGDTPPHGRPLALMRARGSVTEAERTVWKHWSDQELLQSWPWARWLLDVKWLTMPYTINIVSLSSFMLHCTRKQEVAKNTLKCLMLLMFYSVCISAD